MLLNKYEAFKDTVALGLSVSIRSRSFAELGTLSPASNTTGAPIDLVATDMGGDLFHAEATSDDGLAFLELITEKEEAARNGWRNVAGDGKNMR